ncbi:MAG: cytochrome P450 [Candidatus Rokuibacteriota bacterium]|nr:MAG: cytochrome P450 [Candidatus Rokubacteria bacterium]
MPDRPDTSPEHLPTGVELTALDPTFRADPYPVFARLRESGPVHRDDDIKRWVLTSHDDVDRVLRDRTMAVDPRKATPGTYMHLFLSTRGREHSMLMQDAPAHTRLRALVSKAFTAPRVERLAPRIHDIIDGLLDAVEGQESFDLIEAFAGPLPVIVIAEMLGVDAADHRDFKRWSYWIGMTLNPRLTDGERAGIAAAIEESDTYLERVIAERRGQPGEDLISAMILAEEQGDQLTDDEIVTMCRLLLAAGNLTTTDLIGNGVWTLLRHPAELQKLRDDPSLIKNAVEEILRFESPVVQTARIPMKDLEVGGCPITSGESVLSFVAAANRDPAVYPEPDRFDVSREDVHHHSFGGGAHFCLGAPLARLEAQMAIAALVRRFPHLRLADEPLDWRAIPAFRGLAGLRVVVKEASA